MRKTTYLLLLLTMLPCRTMAQNLVVNPSFEDYLNCPDAEGQIDSVIGWNAIWGSSDFFHVCGDSIVSVPKSYFGYQWPSEGSGYGGVLIGPDVYNKEYMQGSLFAALQPGMVAYVSMRVSPSGFGYVDPNFDTPGLAGSHAGLRFSTQPFAQQAYPIGYFHYNTAVLYMPTILSDTSAWTVVSTTFIPDSAYQYVQIGNFFADSLCSSVVLDPGSGDYAAYAFVDMVCVSQQEGVCDPVQSVPSPSATVLPQGLLITDQIRLDLPAWGLDGAVEGAMLFDAAGKLVAMRSLQGTQGVVSWSMPDLRSGLYVLVLDVRDRPALRVRSWK